MSDFTPSKNENEYFARLDAELRKSLREQANAERAKAIEAERHNCPRCHTKLETKEFQHVHIDQCPQCGGIWLDKGELEILAAGNRKESGFLGALLHLGR